MKKIKTNARKILRRHNSRQICLFTPVEKNVKRDLGRKRGGLVDRTTEPIDNHYHFHSNIAIVHPCLVDGKGENSAYQSAYTCVVAECLQTEGSTATLIYR